MADQCRVGKKWFTPEPECLAYCHGRQLTALLKKTALKKSSWEQNQSPSSLTPRCWSALQVVSAVKRWMLQNRKAFVWSENPLSLWHQLEKCLHDSSMMVTAVWSMAACWRCSGQPGLRWCQVRWGPIESFHTHWDSVSHNSSLFVACDICVVHYWWP